MKNSGKAMRPSYSKITLGQLTATIFDYPPFYMFEYFNEKSSKKESIRVTGRSLKDSRAKR
jgi:hypothetical protein